MSKHITELNGKEQFDKHIGEGITFVDFWAPWCGPCLMVAPVIEQLAEAWEGKVKVAKVNTDENFEIASMFGIQGIPTFILFKDGKMIDRMVGAGQKAVFEQFVSKHLN